MPGLNDTGRPKYLALIGDLAPILSVQFREEAGDRIEVACSRANIERKDLLAVRASATTGTQFQTLLWRAKDIMPILISFEEELLAATVRYGIGYGELSTDAPDTASTLEGSCIDRARDALRRSKKQDRWVTLSGFSAELDKILNGLFGLMGEIRQSWTRVQWETVARMRKASTQKEVAHMRKVAAPTVNKALKAALYDRMLEAEDAATVLLARSEEVAAGLIQR